ncbi:hypothetical protein BHT95_01675 [Bacillus paralicheniformis]|uniref:hypothetical protein n=1 Tax=Bacillus TaxID=1386 RepID=UPI0003A4CDC1|nr:hypothetical protein [Bacillus paralicheniformis]MSN98942.1 hypothetical protein [Bacillus paralicheniformis]MSO02950.1 hypothetical protein [Bacillus paralicheniformis]MSO06943.1 hypothetical protein [Bacillus paralicheniformis]MSO10937.1 hypothetical protein [Bacillus paralicheniformis]NJE35977.1 hypothetical protein [Bacillus paralicheniformis]
MKNLALSILYLLGFVMLSSWSVSFGEMFGVNVSAIPQFILAMLFTLIIGGYMGLPLIYIKFKRSETLFFTNQQVFLITLGLGVLLSCTAYSLQQALSPIAIALLSIIGFLIIGISGFLPAWLLKPVNSL